MFACLDSHWIKRFFVDIFSKIKKNKFSTFHGFHTKSFFILYIDGVKRGEVGIKKN